jgi:methylphosphotriester-DNA--protein-cysteine methyltransferase
MMTVVHDDAPGWLCAACVFIESNAADHVSVVEVASAVGVEPEQLLRDFRRCLGFTPADLLDDVLTTRPRSVGR